MDRRPIHHEPPRARSAVPVLAATVALLVASVSAYVPLLRVQNDLFLNGLPPADGSDPRGDADLQAGAAALTAYWPLVAVIVVAYLGVLHLVRISRSRWPGIVAMAAGIVGQLVMLPVKPGLSMDLYSYVAHGFFASSTSMSPYTTSTAAVFPTPLGSQLLYAGWLPVHPQTPYGPVWTDIEGAAFSAADGSVWTSALYMKVVVVLASIGTGLLAFLIAERLRPGTGLLAGTAWLLNPVPAIEFAGDGHNDALAILFVALAFWAALRGWGALAVPALALGVLVKYTPAAFGLALLVMVVRSASSRRRAVAGIAAGVVIAAALAVLLWLPWWNGPTTLTGLHDSTTAHPSMSPAGWLAMTFPDQWGNGSSIVPEVVLGGVLVVVILAASWGRTRRQALLGCAVIAVTVLAVSPIYWPWYSALAIAVLALRPTGPALAVIAVLTIGSRVAGPWGDAPMIGLVPFDAASQVGALAGLSVPVALCIVIAVVSFAARLLGARGRRRRTPVLDAGEAPADGRRAEPAQT
jgi:alpha-1,6-mannosyltransferase